MGLTFTEGELARAYNKVRDELRDVRLLADGWYLDDIECRAHWEPSAIFDRECARVYDADVSWVGSWLGFEPGTIYVFTAAPVRSHVPGGTLVDVIRHEFAHAWAWRDRPFFRGRWFRDAFGATYHSDPWADPDDFDRADYVSEYATKQAKEDFAETFMVYLRDRRKLSTYRRRGGLFTKLLAVEAAVEEAAANRVYTARRPR